MSRTVEAFNPRLVVGMIVAGLVAFAILLLLLAYGGGLGSRPQGAAHFQSKAATGYKGLVDLVGRLRSTSVVDDPDDVYGEDLFVVALQESHRPDQVRQLLERRQGRATLLILPKWFTVQDPVRRGWVRSAGSGAGAVAGPLLGQRIIVQHPDVPLPSRANGGDFLTGLDVPVPWQPQLVKGEQLTSLIQVGDEGILVAKMGDQPHYLLADPDLMNNHGLRDPDVARSALALLDSLNATGAKGITFDTASDLGAAVGPSLLRLAFEPPFLAMTLALVFAALLAGLHGAFRFGPPRREERAIPFGKAALVENGAGLIRLAGREAKLGRAYADLIRQDAARSTGAPQWLGSQALDQYLDRVRKPGQQRFSELARRLDQASDRSSVVEAARALFQWRKEIIR
jgi:hypothetical protein